MPEIYTLDEQFDAIVQAQLATGQYRDAPDVLRAALRLMQERDRRLAVLDAAITRGVGESEANDVEDLDDICRELQAELAALPVATRPLIEVGRGSLPARPFRESEENHPPMQVLAVFGVQTSRPV